MTKNDRSNAGRFSLLWVGLASVGWISFLPTTVLGFIGSYLNVKKLQEKRLTGAGLFGAIAGTLTYVWLPLSLSQSLLVILVATAFAIFVAHKAEIVFGVHDDSRIVIDEWVGVWVALWGLPPVLGIPVLLGLILFRFWDVLKGPWGLLLQKLPGGYGIVLDDIAAGVVANLCWRGLVFLWPSIYHWT